MKRIPEGLLNDEIVCFLADRYHTTAKEVMQHFLIQSHNAVDPSVEDFHLQENEMEILHDLTYGCHDNFSWREQKDNGKRTKYMDITRFKEYVRTCKVLDSEEIHRFMDEKSDEARRITFRMNTAYHTQDEIRNMLSELFGYQVPRTLRVFPPFYTDFGKNINIGENVFINACCHFQDHGGVTIGDGCQIGHNVVFATLNHGMRPEERNHTCPAPIVLGRNVWIGSNSTILQGVTIGDNAVVAAGAVVTRDVAANTVVGGVPAKFIKSI